jgi:hypothetical protein
VTTSLVRALERPLPCACACWEGLTLAQRTAGIRALYRFDDAMHGWGYRPDYTPGADQLFRAAQWAGDPGYRGVAVREGPCIYRRLVGFAVHELLHALQGDPVQPNYGIPLGLPYGVPLTVPEGEEAAYLDPFNRGEARAWVGVPILAEALFAIDWTVRTARDVGTYGFAVGNALIAVPPGYRPVPHVDRQHQPQRYYALGRRLEEEERAWFTPERVAELVARFEAAESAAPQQKRPAPERLARVAPRWPERNDPCFCGSGQKWKKCCGAGRA